MAFMVVKMMQQQIEQFEESLRMSDEVITKEHNSISEFREVLFQCIDRDNQLRKLGVQIAVG